MRNIENKDSLIGGECMIPGTPIVAVVQFDEEGIEKGSDDLHCPILADDE